MRLITLLFVCFTVVAAAPNAANVDLRIVGGDTVAISHWPQVANVLFTWNSATFEQYCGGVILSDETILTAAHCVFFHPASRFRLRIGSALSSSGGTAVNVASLVPHPFYNTITEDHDVALIRTATVITFTNQIQAASIANIGYQLGDNEAVTAIGWGAEQYNGPRSEQLREVQIWTVNQQECARRYATENVVITDNMLCAGWLDVGGRGPCQGDTGGPLFHNGIVVGVYSFGINCANRFYPSVSTRIPRVADWINANV